nr:hypothetical protein [Variovorax sp. MHTC-1]
MKRTDTSASALKEWVRRGVVIPVSSRRGPGNHAEYDDANVIAVMVAKVLQDLHSSVLRYAPAFAELHAGLRTRSTIEWRQLSVALTPHTVEFLSDRAPISRGCIMIDLDKLSGLLAPPAFDPQLQFIFGIASANQWKDVYAKISAKSAEH